MAANDGTGQNWDITNPEDTDYMKNGAMEIRDLRKGIEIRINKEHDTLADNSAGGEHKAGSAKAYVGTTNPTKRPDGVTNLGASDAGRLFVNSSTNVLHTLTAAAQWLAAGAGHLYSIIAGNFIISKRSGTYSYAFQNSNAPALKIAPSATINGDDFDFNKSLELAPTGNVTVRGNLACNNITASGATVSGSTVLTAANINNVLNATVLTDKNFQTTHVRADLVAPGTDALAAFVPIVSMGSFIGNGWEKTITAFKSGYVVEHVTVFANQPGTGISRVLMEANRFGGTGIYFKSDFTFVPEAPPILYENTFTITTLPFADGWQHWWTAIGYKA